MHKSYTGIRLYTVLVRTVAKMGVENGRAEEKGGEEGDSIRLVKGGFGTKE